MPSTQYIHEIVIITPLPISSNHNFLLAIIFIKHFNNFSSIKLFHYKEFRNLGKDSSLNFISSSTPISVLSVK